MIVAAGLWFTDQWPVERTDLLLFGGWAVMLATAVYLTSNVTRILGRHRLHVLRQRRRIRTMSGELRRQNQAMMQQEKMAAMGQLAAGVAHEITNPLASMDSLLQLIQRRPDRVQTDTVDKLREQVARINEIVRQLTNFAHPGGGERQTVPISDVISRTLEMASYHRRFRDVQTEIHQDPSLEGVLVSAEPYSLEQVLVNILLNALDAMSDQPEPRLHIRAWQEGSECFIEMTDNGHGIAPEHMDLLFEPFFTTKPVAKGTGLGLAISDRLVRRHGGRINVENQATGGAKFTICLPVVPAGVSQMARNSTPESNG